MATCIRCKGWVAGPDGNTICTSCAGELVDKANPDELLALAKVGMDALVDEATGYEKIRAANDLRERLRIYAGIQRRLEG